MAKHFYKILYYRANSIIPINQKTQAELVSTLETTPGKSIELELNNLNVLYPPLAHLCVSPVKLKIASKIIKVVERTLVGTYTIFYLINTSTVEFKIEIFTSKTCDKVLIFGGLVEHSSSNSLVYMRKVKNIKYDLHRIVDVTDLFTPYEIAENS